MEIITIESGAYQKLEDRIKRIEQLVIKATADNDTPDEDVWIGTNEASKILGVSIRTLQNYRSKGTIDYRHCGKFCRYRLSEVKSLIAQGYGNRH